MLLKFFPGADDDFFVGLNLLVGVKLGYTTNFTALGYVEVP